MKQVGIIPLIIGAAVSLFGVVAGAIQQGDADKARVAQAAKAAKAAKELEDSRLKSQQESQNFWKENIPILAVSGLFGTVILVKIFKKKNNE